ncbi:MAG: hypothetical protein A2359_01065 [Candidatus Moranbacteria bacterium RIFOXYB1_FULL_43_19]|nr:MAG: hypothetical protein A2359_01065 [Candidatus Moranbacteria bacterium RIFOXYB1_FULL_43_19]OGI27419.1 MAG: hypothetical protein A2184_03370 [Candidatus Moranbacteria bacterium RIFOXYA1_FULL_44_7]OGI33005.1 MAG: hypothetical protein A2420_01490 [Candidatus Moranbacteria bacterium RIFOXYC1_FULL_44_13]OGI38220.1 MAG: hypothetical protein A2612_04475 [Candidatus Moranbacteria bacterium RIFOXYD1_FULL_44_12]
MLDKEKHQLIMGQILKDIYSDIEIASFLGFKGGTCAYFFFGLTRFSVDLDFDLLADGKSVRETTFKKIKRILRKYGAIKDSYLKRNTIFALLSYGDAEHNIKIEISTRLFAPDMRDFFELKEFLGISMPAAKKEYLFAGKLAALVSRKITAARDIYDIRYFAKNNWDIDREALKLLTGKNIREHLKQCVATIEKMNENQILQGIGELVDEKEKIWVKKNLKSEAVFLLKNYALALK